MATKKYEGMRIMSLEGSVLYKNEGFTATKDGKPDPQAFRGILDESLDTLKLAEVYDRHEDEIGYPYLDGKKRFCRAVVNLSFNRAVKVFESYGNRYVLNGYRMAYTNYQLLNTLGLTREGIGKLLEPSFRYLQDMLDRSPVLRYQINKSAMRTESITTSSPRSVRYR